MSIFSFKYKLYPLNRDLSATWFIEYSINGGRRQKKYGKLNKLPTVANREDEAKRLVALIQSGGGATNIAFLSGERNKLVKALTAELKTRCVGLRKKSKAGYESKVAIFVKWYRSQPGEVIEAGQIGNAFLTHLIQEGKHPTTVHLYKSLLESLFNAIGLQNQFSIKTSRKNTSYRFFEEYDQNRLIAAFSTHPQLLLCVQMIYFLLVRPVCEARLLQVGYFNIRQQSLTIPWEISKNKKTQTIRIPDVFVPALEFIQRYPTQFYVLGQDGVPSDKPRCKKYFSDLHQSIIKSLGFNTKIYKLYSWKHTGAVMYYLSTKDIKGLKEQGRWHSLDMVNEYLKNLGVLEMEEVKSSYPVIGGASTMKSKLKPGQMIVVR